jgi:hypothetical protein
MKIGLQVQSKHFINQLGKKSNALQVVAADTLNESAEEINKNYKIRLKRNTKLRNKFSLNSVKIFKAHGISKSGVPRPLHKIDAVVGVRKMKGGKRHYLDKLEKGGTTRGGRMTLGKVPIPLKTARVAKSDSRVISKGHRLTTSKTHTLRVGGKRIGVRGDGYNSTRKRWGVVYGASRANRLNGDPKKPFYMIGNDGKQGIYKMFGKKIRKIRNLSKSSVRRKAEPHFQKSVKQESPKRIQQRFIRNAQKKQGM